MLHGTCIHGTDTITGANLVDDNQISVGLCAAMGNAGTQIWRSTFGRCPEGRSPGRGPLTEKTASNLSHVTLQPSGDSKRTQIIRFRYGYG